jgi:hypothetical protein
MRRPRHSRQIGRLSSGGSLVTPRLSLTRAPTARLRWPFAIGLVLACASATPARIAQLRGFEAAAPLKTEASPRYSASYALLIGNSHYANGWQTLGSIPTELTKVQEVLQQYGFEVTTLYDLDGASLRAAFDKFIQQHGLGDPDARLVFFFSGHGHTDGAHGYIVGTDAPQPDPLTHPGPEFLQRSLPMSQFVEWGRQIKAKHALFAFDSCFSGSILAERGDSPAVSTYMGLPTRQFLTAGRAGETVPAVSVFAEMFVAGLSPQMHKADLNNDGYVTGEELGYYLKWELPRRRPTQHPQFALHPDAEYHEGDMIFKVAETAPVTQTSAAAELSDPNGAIRYKSDKSAYLHVDGVDVEISKTKLDRLIEQNDELRMQRNYSRLEAAVELKKALTLAAQDQLRLRGQFLRLRTIGYVGGGIALAVAGGFIVRMVSKENDAKSSCQGDLCRQAGFDYRRQSRTAGDVATGLLYGGLALGLAGAMFEYFAPDAEYRRAPAPAGLTLGLSGGALRVRW